ncbi:MAG: hypothetical protein GY754_47365 [bacterium]|nr:hypothetical protein [bacterium]
MILVLRFSKPPPLAFFFGRVAAFRFPTEFLMLYVPIVRKKMFPAVAAFTFSDSRHSLITPQAKDKKKKIEEKKKKENEEKILKLNT